MGWAVWKIFIVCHLFRHLEVIHYDQPARHHWLPCKWNIKPKANGNVSNLNWGPMKYPIIFPYSLANVGEWRKIQDPALGALKRGSHLQEAKDHWAKVNSILRWWYSHLKVSDSSIISFSQMTTFPWVSWRARSRWRDTEAALAEMTMILSGARCSKRRQR